MYRLQFHYDRLSPLLVYALVIATVFLVAQRRLQDAATTKDQTTADHQATPVGSAPYFSLSTNRTFGSGENPRLWLDYSGIESLDFRIYRINDPQGFFAQLNDPHQIGEYERGEVVPSLPSRPTALERLREVKIWAYSRIRNYFHRQLQEKTRYSFNQKFRATKRQPLNVADFGTKPLLNSNQLVTGWRELLPSLDNYYDRRMIPLGKRESGVYLVEAVGADLRAYTVVVVTDLAMVEKASRNGELLVYAVDRKTGAPRANTRVELVNSRTTLASGRTNNEGIFRTRLLVSEPNLDPVDANLGNGDVIVMASDRENFAISDLDSYYFNFGEAKIHGQIYTDRPIYQPRHRVFFRGILRGFDERGQYRSLGGQSVSVSVTDSNDSRVFASKLRLSKFGTFNGELTLTKEASLGTYRIEAQTDEGSSTGTFDVAEYKKPEYEVSVSTPNRFVPAGDRSKFDIDARDFFGAPVTGAEVKYYVYRSRYYPTTDERDSDEVPNDDEYSQYQDHYSDLVLDGEGKLDAAGHLEIDFDVPAPKETDVWDFQYRLEAEVIDSSRRSLEGNATMVATRGSIIANAEPNRYVYSTGETAKINVSTTDYEGRPVPAKLTLSFVRRTRATVERAEQNDYSLYETREEEIGAGEVSTNQDGFATYDFPVTTPGSIAIKTVVQEAGKQVVSVGGFIWTTSDDSDWASSLSYDGMAHSIKLVSDQKSYRPGETAHVLAILPAEHTNLLVTTELNSIISARQVSVTGRSAILDLQINESDAPNVFLNVTFVRDGEMYTGNLNLPVPARDKILDLEVIPNKEEYKPHETASFTILARDANGEPVPNAEVSLGVVDETIYSIATDYSGNIQQQFYGRRYNEVQTVLSVSYSFRGFAGSKPVDLAAVKASYQLADFKNESEPVQLILRKDSKDTAFWEPDAITGKDGRATVKFRLPDNLTTWRATARGVTSDTRVGITIQKVISLIGAKSERRAT